MKEIIFGKLTPRYVPLIFSAFPAGTVDIDRCAAWIAFDRSDKKTPVAVLVFDSMTPMASQVGVFRYRFLEETTELYAPSFFEQVRFLAKRRGFGKVGVKGQVLGKSEQYELLESVGFESAEQLEQYSVEGIEKIEAICDDHDELYQKLLHRDAPPKYFTVLSLESASLEGVHALVAESLGDVRRSLDVSPLHSVDKKRSIVLLDQNQLVGAALVRPYPSGKGFHVAAMVIEEKYRMTSATQLLSRELLGRMIESGAESYSFETNPKTAKSMLNHAKMNEFTHIDTCHFMVMSV